MARKRTKKHDPQQQRVDEIAAQLDDVGMIIDEVAADPAAADVTDKLKDARKTVDRAVDTIDDIADKEPRRDRR